MTANERRGPHSAGIGDPASATEVRGRVTAGGSLRPLAALAVVIAMVLGLLWAVGGSGDRGSAAPVGTTVPPSVPAPVPGATTTSTAAPSRPVLNEVSGHQLFYGGDAPLQRLDLDTGTSTTFGLRAHPVLVTGRTLVLYQEESDRIGWVPLADPAQQVQTWKRGFVATGNGPNLLWVLDPAGEPDPAELRPGMGTGVWEQYLVNTNQAVETTPADLHPEVEADELGAEPLGGAVRVLRNRGPSNRPDGVYLPLRGDGGLEDVRIAPGRFLAFDGVGSGGDDRLLALAGTCGPEGPCDLSWFDLSSFEEGFDHPLPAVRPRRVYNVAGGTWLHSIGWDGRSELLEIDTGRRIEHDWETARPTISPDGRWLAELDGDSVVVTDLETEEAVTVAGGFDLEGSGSLLFVPRL